MRLPGPRPATDRMALFASYGRSMRDCRRARSFARSKPSLRRQHGLLFHCLVASVFTLVAPFPRLYRNTQFGRFNPFPDETASLDLSGTYEQGFLRPARGSGRFAAGSALCARCTALLLERARAL
jgi:hypothetical protein